MNELRATEEAGPDMGAALVVNGITSILDAHFDLS